MIGKNTYIGWSITDPFSHVLSQNALNKHMLSSIFSLIQTLEYACKTEKPNLREMADIHGVLFLIIFVVSLPATFIISIRSINLVLPDIHYMFWTWRESLNSHINIVGRLGRGGHTPGQM